LGLARAAAALANFALRLACARAVLAEGQFALAKVVFALTNFAPAQACAAPGLA